MASEDSLNSVIERVSAQKDVWAKQTAKEKLEILDELMNNTKMQYEVFHAASIRKRDQMYQPNAYHALSTRDQKIVGLASEAAHWLHSSMLLGTWLSQLREYYASLSSTGKGPNPLSVRPNNYSPDGKEQYFVKVGPKGLLYTTMLSFGSMELLVDGPVEQECLLDSPSQLVTVMGAGNFDGPIDLLTAMFIENSVCIYKANPFNTELLSCLESIFEPLIKRNFLALTVGGPDVGNALIMHPLVDKWYITGSAASAYKILWGEPHPPQELDANPKIQKPFTCELGNCTPWIVCPGNWSNMELDWHASTIAAGMTFNGGHICVHPQVIVTCKNWKQRSQFLALVRKHLSAVKYIGCYYPDFEARIQSANKKCAELGISSEDVEISINTPLSGKPVAETNTSVLFATDLPHDCFIISEEMFCPVCGEVALDTAATIEEFLPEAVEYVNNKVSGSLSVSVSVKASSNTENEAVEKAISNLDYGSVHINTDTKMSIAFPCLVWGGKPGSTVHSLDSGIGFFGNCFGYKRPIKSVVRAPFLNFTHMLLCPSKEENAKKHSKLWRRITGAVVDQRSTQGWWNYTGHLTKIMSAFIANL